MESKWLEDFISLAETRSFSRSAEARHVTQPAFSRRIRSLETWLGADLVDRTTYPTQLTPAGEVFREAGPEAEEKREQIEAALAEAINRQKISAEGIVMDSSSWVISAINPHQ